MNTDADLCLVVEGAYPHVTGGVSVWVHELIRAQRALRVHVVALVATATPQPLRYELPPNVVGMSTIVLQQEPSRVPAGRGAEALVREFERPLRALLRGGGKHELAEILVALRRHPRYADPAQLLNSKPAFDLLERLYGEVDGSSFLHFFWSWRSLVGGLLAVLLAPLPRARLYHAVSTGYAGLLMARAVIEHGRPGLLTEHGIYTNERRIEIAMAEWLANPATASLVLEKTRRDLRDLWLDAFASYARACYECACRVVTLYEGNQPQQLRGGAPANRLLVIPNGIDVEAFAAIARDPAPRAPTVALIGRIVPIKDVKTFVRAVALLREMVPGVRALLLGPTDEDRAYVRECAAMVEHLGLDETIEFAGRVRLSDHLGRIDVVALTSLSEAQPLVLLEAGAAGVPCVATDVGACREILEGRADEDPPLGPGGFVTPLANPRATAEAIARLLFDAPLRARLGRALQQRARCHYSKEFVDRRYAALYDVHLAATVAA